MLTAAVLSPTPSEVPTLSPTPVEQRATATPTPTPDYVWVVITENAKCRLGAARWYGVAGFIAAGEVVQAHGQSPDGKWWWVTMPDGSERCWVSGALVSQPSPTFSTPTSLAPVETDPSPSQSTPVSSPTKIAPD